MPGSFSAPNASGKSRVLDNEEKTLPRVRAYAQKEGMETPCKKRQYMKMMKFEIMNPSDEAYIEGSFEACCLATLLHGDGSYALQQVGGDLWMPPLFLGGLDEWCMKQFGKSFEAFSETVPEEEVRDALLSVHLARERTSCNDFTSHAHHLGNLFDTKIKKKANKAEGGRS